MRVFRKLKRPLALAVAAATCLTTLLPNSVMAAEPESFVVNDLENVAVLSDAEVVSVYQVKTDAGENGFIRLTDEFGTVKLGEDGAPVKYQNLSEDETVYFFVSADEGYDVADIRVEDAISNSLSFDTDTEKNLYSFDMPESDVVIKASFAEIEFSNVANDFSMEEAMTVVAEAESNEDIQTENVTNTVEKIDSVEESVTEVSEEVVSETSDDAKSVEEVNDKDTPVDETTVIGDEIDKISVEEETRAEEETTALIEEVVKENVEPEYSDAMKAILSSYNFANGRLIVATGNANILAEFSDSIISSFNGMYILQFESQQDAMAAFAKLYSNVEFLAVDSEMTVDAPADENVDFVSAEDIMTENDNPFEELKEAIVESPSISYDIAVIDTGANASVTNAVSMLGDDPSDDNGHGTKMVSYILEQNPDARILSIKAFDASGKADISAVYAAFEYAISQNVKIINLSASAIATQDNSIVAEVIRKAIANGITVVGSAGNNGNNVAYYIPGNIDEAYIIGACNADGERLSSSNYGATVDYNVVASSTSEAAAKFSGYISKSGVENIPDDVLIFSTSGKTVEKDDSLPLYHEVLADGSFGIDAITLYTVAGVGDNDVLYYTESLGDPFGMNENYVPMYCIQHWLKAPHGASYSEFTSNSAVLGYIMRHGYPNTTWGLNWKEAQYITQAAVYMALGVPAYETSTYGDHIIYNPGEIYDMIWGNGNFYLASNLVSQASANATTADADFVRFWDSADDNYQNMISPLPNITYGYVDLTKASSPASAKNSYTMEGAVYPVYTNSGATTLFTSDGYYWGFKIDSANKAYAARCATSKDVNNRNNWVYYTPQSSSLTFETGTKIWIKELIAPTNGQYDKDTQAHAVTIGNNTTVHVSSTDELGYVDISINKVSANTSITNGNACYTLAGAQYTLKDSSGKTVGTFTTKADGSSNTIRVQNTGTYYIKESVPSSGFAINTENITVNVTKLDKSSIVKTSSEQLLNDPIFIRLHKIDADTKKEVPEGNATFDKTQFELKYYANTSGNTSGDATRTYVFETNGAFLNLASDMNGEIMDGTKVSGDYYLLNNSVTWPLGTYVLTEKSTPVGYLTNETWKDYENNELSMPLVFSVVDTGNGTATTQYTTKAGTKTNLSANGYFEAVEPVIRGNFKFFKYDADNKSTTPQGDASLTGGSYDIINISNGSVEVNGVEYAKNAVVYSFKTKDNSEFVAPDRLLPYGDYRIVETSAPEGYNLEGKLQTEFSITYDGQTADLNLTDKIENPVIRGGFTFQKADTETKKITPQGDATLAGGTYEVINMSTRNVTVRGVSYAPGAIVYTFTTGATKFESPTDLLPYGRYQLVETKAPTGYKLEGTLVKNFTISKEGGIENLEKSINNEVIRGGFKIAKNDSVFGHDFQGDSDSLKTTYEIINKSQNEVKVNGSLYAVNATIMQFTTDDNGYYATASDLLPYGTYQINEVTAPENYTDEGVTSWTFSVREDGKVYENVDKSSSNTALENEIFRGGFTFNKLDIETQKTTPQGDATLIGGTYNIINKSLHKVSVEGKTYQPNEVCYTFTTRGTNSFTSADDLLPYGTYELVEVKEPLGYLNEGIISTTFQIRKDKKIVDVTAKIQNEVIRGGVKVQKINEELDTNENEGLSSLADCEIAIVNASLNEVLVDGVLYQNINDRAANKSDAKNSATRTGVGYTRDELVKVVNEAGYDNVVVKTLVTDANGFATTEADTLPYGTYYLYEVSANESMMLDEDWVVRIEVREDGEIIDATTLPVEDPIVRGDISFNKVNIDGIFRPNVPFLFVALDENGNALEAHVVVTDAEGLINTASRDNTKNTNGFDQYVVYDKESKEYYVNEEGEALLQSGEAQTWGVWFSQGRDTQTGARTSTKATPTNNRGALYYGNYQIFEIKCNDNTEKEEDLLYSPIIPVYEKTTVVDDFGQARSESSDKLINYHPFVDLEVVLTSKALDDITNTHVTFVHDNLTLSDRVTYTHLKATTTYKWVVKFVQTSNPANVLSTVTIDGYVPATSSTNVQTAEGAFTIHTDGTMTDANCASEPTITTTGNVDTTGLDGETISAIVYLYEYTSGYDYTTEELVGVLDFIKSHNTDVSDVNEMIYIPSMETVASDVFTKDNVGTKDQKDAIIDNVDITNLGPKEKYKLIETIMDEETGEVFAQAEQAVHSFYSNRPDFDYVETWHVEMPEIAIDSSAFAAKTLVAFEELWRVNDEGEFIDAIPVVTHKSLIDESQSIHYIDINTNATDEFTGDHVGTVTEKTTITDSVELFNLIPGMDYTIKGELVYQADCTDSNGVAHKAGEILPVLDGSEVEKTITADADYMTIEISYVIDSSMLEGITVVSTEYAYHNDVLIDKHVDLEDEDQSVHFPKVRTTAVDKDTADDVGNAHEDVTIVDSVTVENLIPGMTYSIIGRLINQADGSEYVQDGVTVTPCEFTAEEAKEIHEITFSGIDGEFLSGNTLVVYEVLMHNNVNVARHEDINDKSQTVHYPYISTNAVDSETKDHVGSIFGKAINSIRKALGEDVEESATQAIVDTVTLGNLVPGRTYIVSGVLMDKATGEAILVNGEKVVQSATVIAGENSIISTNGEKTTVTSWNEEKNSVSGTVDLVFTLDSAELIKYNTDDETATSMVVFEKLIHNDVIVTEHEDINDDDQTVTDVEIRTTAIDSRTGDHVGDSPRASTTDANVEDEVQTSIIDTVRMKGLVPDMEYTLKGLLVLKDESTPDSIMYLKSDGTTTANADEAISAETTFTATDSSDSKELTFAVSSEKVTGKTVVVFEKLYHNDVMISAHADITDEGQTVHYPKVTTDLADTQTGDDVGTVGTTVVVDKVTYENLISSEDYTVSGKLAYQMDCVDKLGQEHKAGEWVADPITGEIYTASAELKAGMHDANGTVELSFEVNSAVLAGLSVVAEESLIHNDVVVAAHADLDDDAQTVHFPDIKTEAIDTHTGDHVGTIFGDLINAIRKLFGEELDTTEQTVRDRVSLTNLVPGRTYTVSGVLMNKTTGEALLVNGEEVTQTTTITVGENSIVAENGELTSVTKWDAEHNFVNGTVDLIFTFDSSKAINYGTEDEEAFVAVVFESLYHNDVKVVSHEDIDDEDQSVYQVSIHTTAIDTRTGDHVGDTPRATSTDSHVEDEVSTTISDTVLLDGLLPDMEYTVKGSLVLKAESSDEKIVYLKADGTATENREEAISAELTFVAEETLAEVTLEFEVSSELVAGKAVVVSEELFHNDVRISTHTDINDEEQTIYFPNVTTNLSDAQTGDDVGTVGTTVIIDEVSYEGLMPDEDYTVSGKLAYQIDCVDSRGIPHKAGEWVADPITGEVYNVTAELKAGEHESSGKINIEFNVDTRLIAGLTIVGEESLIHNDVVVAAHADLDDDSQTVHFPDVKTNAVDTRTGDHVGSVFGRLINTLRSWLGETDVNGNGIEDDAEASVIDTVTLTNLVPGRTYTVSGVLMNQMTGKPVIIDGEQITQTATVVAGKNSIVANDGEKTTVTAYDEDHNSISGTVDLTFTYDASKLLKYATDGQEAFTVVVFEGLYHNDVKVAAHEDIHDEAQSIYGASIDSIALDEATNSHVGDTPRHATTDAKIADETSATIVETITYSGLQVGSEYIVNGVLVVKEESSSEKPMYLTADGSVSENREDAITVNEIIVAESADGEVELVFTVDSELVAGKTIVVFDDLIHNDVIIITHSNINDEDQTVHYPSIGTKLYVGGTEYNDSYYNKMVTLIDTVTYENLIPGLTYELDGSIIFKDNGEPVMVDGVAVTDHIAFVPSSANGSVDLAFVFPAAGFEGREIVAYEVLLFAEHKDGANIDKLFYECECGQLFESIDAWQAHLRSFELMCHDGERFLSSDELDEHLVTYGTDSENHYIEASNHDSYVQVKEPVTGNMITVATHADINDRAQTVCLPGLKTILVDQNGTKMPYASDEMKLIDTLYYEALTPGNTYTAKGKLVDKETGVAARDDNGQIITGETTFIAESGTGFVEIEFTFSGLTLAGKSLVAFETLYFEEELVGLHEDITDEDQTVYVPEVMTNAVFDTNIKMANVNAENKIIDTVEYHNLIVGETYQVDGILMDKSTNKPVMVNGKEITSTATFKAEETNGSIELEFVVPANTISGEAVVFEKLYVIDGNVQILVGSHEDITDIAQTVFFPEIKTIAKFQDGAASHASSDTVIVTDTVQYQNLQAGTYIFKATLMNKATGQPVMANGQAITAELRTEISDVNGSVDINIQVPANSIVGDAVVFEEVYAVSEGKEILVGEHKDINDAAQTVVFTAPVAPPKTGDTTNALLWLMIALGAIGITVGTIVAYKRKREE